MGCRTRMPPPSVVACFAFLISTLLYMMSGGKQETFLYFAYGSNMLTQRIRINNPSARFQSLGRLHHHKLDFNHKSKKWGGAVATIEEEQDSEVWGVLWQVILKGAAEHSLPNHYREKLEKIEHNDGLGDGSIQLKDLF